MGHSSEMRKTIVRTVADYENTAPEVLPPLAEKIDSETYQQLLAPERDLTEPLSFEYLWYQVTVLPEGEVVVTP